MKIFRLEDRVGNRIFSSIKVTCDMTVDYRNIQSTFTFLTFATLSQPKLNERAGFRRAHSVR